MPRPRPLLLVATVSWPVVIAASARVDLPVPGSPVPVSLQTLTVVLAGLLLGPAWGTVAVALYLVAGAAGLPVLADGAAGLDVMSGPSVGYLVGFLACALVAGLMRGSLLRDLLGGVSGQALVLLLGVLGLVLGSGLAVVDAVTVGALPFLPGMLLKALVAAAMTEGWRRLRFQ